MTARTIVLAVGLGTLAMGLAALPIDSDVYEGGEAREALVAREMIRTGDWILPLWNGNVVPSKPPLFHWLVAGSTRLSGSDVTERTLRAPSVVLAGLVVVLIVLAGGAWGSWEVGLLAGIVLATTPQFLKEAGDGRVDMTLCAAVTAAQCLVIHTMRVGRREAPLVMLAVCLGLAMLAKGPVGPGLVGLSALVFAASVRRPRLVLQLVRPLPVLVFLALAGSWYLLAYLHRGDVFIAKQILSENAEALLGGERIPYRSPLSYVGPLILGGLPWTLLLPWALVHAWRGDLARRYCAIWATTVFVFFSFAPLKRGAYLLPLRPALALAVGWWLADLAREKGRSSRLVVPAIALEILAGAGGILCAGAALAVKYGRVPIRQLIAYAARHEVDGGAYLAAIMAASDEIVALGLAGAIAAGFAARALGRAQWRAAALATAAVVTCATVLMQWWFVPARAAQKSVRVFAYAVRARVAPEDSLTLLASAEDIPFIFYVGRNVPVLMPRGSLPPPVGEGYYVLDAQRWRGWNGPAGWEEVMVSPHRFSHHRSDLVLVRRP
jgi:4-amino-4-deoxy-L-arabinose transferase-like glycosyltransferase